MKILFRTSGGSNPKNELGMGHIYRCINLSTQLKPHKIIFLIEDFGSVTKALRKNNLRTTKLIPGINDKEDVKKTIECIDKNQIDVLIIDKYGLTNNYVNALRKKVKVVVITDLRNIQYNADLIINGFIGYDNSISFNKYKTRCLLGPKYQILNNSFQKVQTRTKKFDLVITLGGFDSNCGIEKILTDIIKMKYNFKILVILGPATKKTKKILKFEKENKEYLTIIKETDNFQKEISNARFGICGGGISTYEFAKMKIPFAIICQYKHQLITAREWANRDIAENLGLFEDNLKKLRCFLEKINRKKLKLKTTKIIDGLGSKRIMKEILKLTND